MKTILRIILILLVAAVFAGAFSLAVNNSIASSSKNNGQPPAMTASQPQPVARPEGGDRDGGSITRGLAGVLGTVAKLTGITILVLVLQKAFNQPGKQKLISAH